MAERREFGYIRKLPSGRYQASYIGPDMQRRGQGPGQLLAAQREEADRRSGGR